jgi:hypothetical protein
MQSTLLWRKAIKLRERDSGSKVTWAGTEYPCASGPAAKSKGLNLDGFAPLADLVIVIRRDILPSIPQPQQTVSYSPGGTGESKSYRIDAVTTTPGDSFVQLALVDINRGA